MPTEDHPVVREAARAGFPWATSALLAAPAFALAAAGAIIGLRTPAGMAVIAAGAVYLVIDLALLQRRVEARAVASSGSEAELAAQRFLQRALEAADVRDVASEFEAAVHLALGPTRAVLIAPSSDGGVRVLAGDKEELATELGDATTAFLWLGEGTNPIYLRDLADQRQAGAEEAGRLMTQLGGEVLLPLRHRGLLLGLGVIGPPQRAETVRLDAFYRAMRAYTAVAVANTFLDAEARDQRQLTHTFDLATAVQESLMPSERPVRRATYSLRGAFRPVAECGGDLWAWRELDEDRVLLVVADATGHGAASALIAAIAKGTIDAHWQLRARDLDPGQLLSALNRAVHRAGRRRYFMTAFVALIDVATRRLTFANAGQNFPYLISARGLEPLVARGDQLGTAPEVRYEVLGRTLEMGDKLLLYTDGFIEAGLPDMEAFGEKRFRGAITSVAAQPAVRVPDLLFARVEDHLQGAPVGDDMTCIAFELSAES